MAGNEREETRKFWADVQSCDKGEQCSSGIRRAFAGADLLSNITPFPSLGRIKLTLAILKAARRGKAAKAADEAYEAAAAGGKHAGFLKNYARRSPQEIDRGIRSIQRSIAEHQSALRDPRRKVPNFDDLDPRQQIGLVNKKWPSDIARQREQLAILERLRRGG